MAIREGDIVYARTCGWQANMPSGTLVRGNACDPPWPRGLVLVDVRGLGDVLAWCHARGARRVGAKR